jgi:hypothetical protein
VIRLKRPAERHKRFLVRLDQHLHSLVLDKLDIRGAAPAQGRDKHREPVAAAPNNRPVDLHLFAWLGRSVSKRMIGSAASFGLSAAIHAFSIV